jgi:hypothetical protein
MGNFCRLVEGAGGVSKRHKQYMLARGSHHKLADDKMPALVFIQVEPLEPPAGARPGERVYFGEGNDKQPAPAEPNRVQKKKIWEGVSTGSVVYSMSKHLPCTLVPTMPPGI